MAPKIISIIKQIETGDAIEMAHEYARRAKIAQEHLAEIRHVHAKLKADYAKLQIDYEALKNQKRAESAEAAWAKVQMLEDQLIKADSLNKRARADIENIMNGMNKCNVCSNRSTKHMFGVCGECKPEWRDDNGIQCRDPDTGEWYEV